MKTIIFADLHQPQAALLSVIEEIVEREQSDRVVFLGDYFDQWDDTPDDAARTAEWLKQSLADTRRTHLIGNHDASYLWPCESTLCLGFTWEKENAIRLILGQDFDRSFGFSTWVDGWLLTHAGLSSTWLSGDIHVDSLKRWLIDEEKGARENFAAGRPHWFVAVGPKRGGMAPAGGILWCDHRELRPIPGIRQIYGHTPADRPRWIGNSHLCLDTAVTNGTQHFAIVTDGVVEVRSLTER